MAKIYSHTFLNANLNPGDAPSLPGPDPGDIFVIREVDLVMPSGLSPLIDWTLELALVAGGPYFVPAIYNHQEGLDTALIWQWQGRLVVTEFWSIQIVNASVGGAVGTSISGYVLSGP
jgi:hypothetical protein